MLDPLKDNRWRQRFENFEKAYHTIEKYAPQHLTSELEQAGLIQLFEVTFELAWKVLKDYLEAEGYTVKSPRETIKLAFQIGVIEDGHVWIDALSSRNLAAHTYDDVTAEKLAREIGQVYFPALQKLYKKLLLEL